MIAAVSDPTRAPRGGLEGPLGLRTALFKATASGAGGLCRVVQEGVAVQGTGAREYYVELCSALGAVNPLRPLPAVLR